MLHVGMNIADKKAVFAEVRRVLKPGGVFAIYDAMLQGDGAFAYPVPWSSEPATNHIATPDAYKAALAAAGFTVVKERNRREAALQSMQRRIEQTAQPIGLPVVMGPTAPRRSATCAHDRARRVRADRAHGDSSMAQEATIAQHLARAACRRPPTSMRAVDGGWSSPARSSS